MKDIVIEFCAGCETAHRVADHVKTCRHCGGAVFRPHLTARTLRRVPTLRVEQRIAWTALDLKCLKIMHISPE